MQRPALSVLINNYNYARFVGRAIDSVLSQDARNVEIIVVDDGSTDQSRSVLEAYDGRVKVIFQENAGQAAAINTAVGSSKGEILCFLDADDWWAPGKLSATSAAFRANPQASLVYHRLQPTLVDGTPTSKPIPRSLCSGALSPLLTRSAGWWPFPMTSAVAVRRSAWDAAGRIPEQFRISADAWLVGIYPFLGDVIAMPDPLGFYRIHNNNWYRPTEDAATLRRRMTHWQHTVEATNQFLSAHELPARLRLTDHYPYRIASAKLQGANARSRLKLAVEGLFFAGEPNLLRRTRDSLRAARGLTGLALDASLSEASK
ncbi:glycosyl transferase (plasmid) [Rhizobium leguminosarum bv. trifolii CB782]|uniref:glycosyltransferase family 2 protein n=1 Tax=Rhizobium hidalgonense TaxID=1538159 RepID=UPI0003E2E9B6|nr:glycosyltransferase [Rhizobium hidalgonense]AHG48715.1 glycosyl transferase [Rhizobium leguminosarum bv. trifolii CB782]RWX19101.1 glycosyltransferase [Rhizobium hidalgonense]